MPGQAMHAASPGDQTTTRFGQGNLRVICCDDDVAGQRELQTTAHRKAVHARNHRLGKMPAHMQATSLRGEFIHLLRLFRGKHARAELQVIAGTERLVTRTRNHTDPDVIVFLDTVPVLRQFVTDVGAECIARFRTIDSDVGDVIANFDLRVDQIRHDKSPSPLTQ